MGALKRIEQLKTRGMLVKCALSLSYLAKSSTRSWYELVDDAQDRYSRAWPQQDARHIDDARHHHRCRRGHRYGVARAGRAGISSRADSECRNESDIRL